MKKILVTIAMIVLAGAVSAQTQNSSQSLDVTDSVLAFHSHQGHDHSTMNAGNPCACGQLKCNKTDSNGNVCGGNMELKLDAFPVYSNTEKCPSCGGKGCSLCGHTGKKYIRTDPGCKCKKCGNLIRQPNDC